MTNLVYARHVRCDWPGCLSEGEVSLGANWPETVLPAGWVNLRPYIIRADGLIVGEVCSIHARATVEQLAAVLSNKPKEASNGNGD